MGNTKITIEELRKFKGLEKKSDKELDEIADGLYKLASFCYYVITKSNDDLLPHSG